MDKNKLKSYNTVNTIFIAFKEVNMTKQSHSFFKVAVIITLNIVMILSAVRIFYIDSHEVLSRVGSSGTEVTRIQEALKDRGYFNVDVTGYYGSITESAVKNFQRDNGLSADGIAGPQTLRALGVSVGSAPDSTEANINLLARIISGEARGETYIGQVAVGAVILNRVKSPIFPDTLAGVIYQRGAFTAVRDGNFEEPVTDSAYQAARDALNGWDPSGGALYYFNPAKTSDAWMHSRPVIVEIGNHKFCS